MASTPHPRRAAAAALLAAPVLLALAGCSGGAPPTATPPPTPAATAAPTETPAPPTVTPTPPPAPTATATPDATVLALAGPPPAPTPFPTPPAMEGTPTPDNGGIARVVVPTLGIDAWVEITRVVDNQMQTPADGSYAIGWYPEFGEPGVSDNAVFSAHETWNHFQGPFYTLHNAQPGDEVDVEMTDGTTYRYAVISRTRYALATIPMDEILWPKERPAGEQWLTLMTCGGRIVYNASGFGEYLDRDVVVARRVQ